MMMANLVFRTFPNHLDQDVELDARIQVEFRSDINVHTLNEDRIILFNVTEQKTEPFTFRYNNRFLTIIPKYHLKPKNHYQVKLIGGQNGIKTITNHPLPQTYVFEFYTKERKEIPAPTILKPTHLSQVDGHVEFVWSHIEQAYYYELEISKSNTFHVLEWPYENHRIYANHVVPDFEFQEGRYYARVRAVDENGFKSAYSLPIQFYYRSSPIQKDEDFIGETETGLPYVEYIRPYHGQTQIKTKKPFRIGTGELMVFLNGMKQAPTSNATLSDGHYREIDEYTIEFVEPLQEGDLVEIIIGQKGEKYHEPSKQLIRLQTELKDQRSSTVHSIKIIGSSPSHGAVNVTVDGEIVIEFDKNILPESVNDDSVYIVEEKN